MSCPPLLTCDEVVHQGGGHAEDAHQQVTDCQIEYEHVGDRPHLAVLHHNEAHQDVADHTHEEDEGVGQDEHCSHRGGMLVVRQEGVVLPREVALTCGRVGPAAIGRAWGKEGSTAKLGEDKAIMLYHMEVGFRICTSAQPGWDVSHWHHLNSPTSLLLLGLHSPAQGTAAPPLKYYFISLVFYIIILMRN